jgi:hypothetical protein
VASIAIATPLWRSTLSRDEIAFLAWTQQTNSSSDLWFVIPDDLDVSPIATRFPRWRFRRFPRAVFASVRTYSLWLTEPHFYEQFSDYEWITICQTDAVLVRSVDYAAFGDVDYVGSPWLPPLRALVLGRRVFVHSSLDESRGLTPARWWGRRLDVGNGGLSTRRVATLIDVTRWARAYYSEATRSHTLEDAFLCAVGPRRGLRVMPGPRAERIYCESGAQGRTTLPDVSGFHALRRWNSALADGLVSAAPL